MFFTCLGTKGSLLKFFPWAEQTHLLSQLRKCIRYLHKLIVRPRPGGSKYSEETCAVSSPGGVVLSKPGINNPLWEKNENFDMRLFLMLSLFSLHQPAQILPGSLQTSSRSWCLWLIADLLFLTLPCADGWGWWFCCCDREYLTFIPFRG